MVKGCLIWNPLSGNAKNYKEDLNLITDFLKQNKIELLQKRTEGPLTAIEIAKDAVRLNCSYIYVFGGDGTINEVINGIYGSDAILGIIPKGTANLLAKEINMPLNTKKALLSLKAAKAISVNLGKAKDRYFILMLGIGFDAFVISKIKLKHKLRWGKLAFVYQAMKQSFLYDYPYFKIKYNQKEINASFAVISLSEEYGSIFTLTPSSKLIGDSFQICLFKGAGSFNYWKYFLYVLAKSHSHLKDVQLDQTKEIEVESEKEIWCQLDGEIYCRLPVKVSLIPKAIKILIPPGSPYYRG